MRKAVFIFILLVTSSLFASNQKMLGVENIRPIMEEILAQHVDEVELTPKMIKSSFQEYIDQFDPARIYLLQEEVDRYVNMSDAEARQVLTQFRQNAFPKYRALNELIVKSIERSRSIRGQALQNFEQIQAERGGEVDDSWKNSEKKRPFAENLNELKIRILDEIVIYIGNEKKRFGRDLVSKHLDQTLDMMNRQMEHIENQYLYANSNGHSLSSPEKENLFAMHILKAFAKSLDSHTSFFTSDEAYDMKMRLEKGFEGIGVVLQREPQGVLITKLVKGSPAERSGKIEVGDQIIKVNGSDVEHDTLEDLIEKLRDKSKTAVDLELRRVDERGNEIINVSLVREMISDNEDRVGIDYERVEGGIIGKLTLNSFYQGDNGISSEKDLRLALAELKNIGEIKGLILDLRENSGGFLIQAVKVAGLFITNGVVVISKYSNGEIKYYRDMDGKISFDGPLIILTSRATASAAEIVAQAIQDYGVGIVVGDTETYGKGTIQSQTVTENDGSSFFKVTVGKYYTVSGETPQLRGVKADIVVPGQFDDEEIGEKYLDHPLSHDQVTSAYTDTLSDVEEGLKPWYERYYIPSLQKREDTWKPLLPTLSKRSEERIKKNHEYKAFLREEGKWSLFKMDDREGDDPQMVEAVDILKDMILYQGSSGPQLVETLN